MPNPRPGEDREDFLDRCIPIVIREGRDPDQAVAICIAYYEGQKDKAYNLQQGQRIEYWKAFDRRRQSFEAKYTKVIYNAIREQLKPLKDATNVNELRVDLKEEPLRDAYVKLYEEVGDVFARSTYSGLKGQKYMETKQAPVWIDRMRKYALIDASSRIVAVTDTTKKEINKIIVQGLENQMSIPQIAGSIYGTPGLQPLNGTLSQRATRIARTEIISASNAGSLEGARSTGLNFQKQWLATPDERTREDHAEANGQTVGKDDPFIVGGEALDYPGHPEGSASNVINCRCTQIYLTGPVDMETAIEEREIEPRAQEPRIPDLDDVNARYTENELGLPSDEIIEEANRRSLESTGQALYAELQGFDGLPTVLSDDVFDSIKDNSNFAKVYRGLYSRSDKETQKYLQDFKTGKLFPGKGIFGNGSYFANEAIPKKAIAYAGGKRENVVFALIDKRNFNMGDYAKEKQRYNTLQSKFMSDLMLKYETKYGANYFSDLKYNDMFYEELRKSPYSDFGSYMTSRGYDGYIVRTGDPTTNYQEITDYTVVLNRTKLRIRKTSGI